VLKTYVLILRTYAQYYVHAAACIGSIHTMNLSGTYSWYYKSFDVGMDSAFVGIPR